MPQNLRPTPFRAAERKRIQCRIVMEETRYQSWNIQYYLEVPSPKLLSCRVIKWRTLYCAVQIGCAVRHVCWMSHVVHCVRYLIHLILRTTVYSSKVNEDELSPKKNFF